MTNPILADYTYRLSGTISKRGIWFMRRVFDAETAV